MLALNTNKKPKIQIEQLGPKYFKSVTCGPRNAFFIDSSLFYINKSFNISKDSNDVWVFGEGSYGQLGIGIFFLINMNH